MTAVWYLPIGGFWVYTAKAMVDSRPRQHRGLCRCPDHHPQGAQLVDPDRRGDVGVSIGAFLRGPIQNCGRRASVSLDFLKYAVGLTDFLGVATPIVLAMVLLLMAQVMLVGRLLGVSRVIWAFVGCIVLITLLFPWQAFSDESDFHIDGI